MLAYLPQSLIIMFAVIGFIIACLTLNVYGSAEPQIVGGSDASDGVYIYQASLRHSSNGQHFCGGAIISKHYVLTAAHCLYSFKRASDLFVAVGSNYLDKPGDIYQVKSFKIHENYKNFTYSDDIALIRVSTDIRFNNKTNQIGLARTDHDYDNSDSIIATGWGRLREDGEVPNNLQEIVLNGYPQEDCQKSFNTISITNSYLCTLTIAGEGMCNGDSGGPLVNNDDLIGLVSFGMKFCASGNPDVHTRVFTYKSWINLTMNYLNDAGGNIIRPNVLILGSLTIYLYIHSVL